MLGHASTANQDLNSNQLQIALASQLHDKTTYTLPIHQHDLSSLSCHHTVKRIQNASLTPHIQPSAIPQDSLFPNVPNYRIVAALGRGAFSTVYKANNITNGHTVALKLINKAPLSPTQETAIHRETLLLGSLSHPNLIRLLDYHDSPQYLTIVTELIEGGELFHKLVAMGSMPEHSTRFIMKQVALGIKYLHLERGIVHRDIKLENLLYVPYDPQSGVEDLSGCGITHVKIADFGLAKVVFDTTTQTPCGTFEYSAPEIFRDEYYSKSVDLWALGCVLYTLLCGYPPFYGENLQVLANRVRYGRFQFQSPWWDSISFEAKNLVCGLLEVNPKKRLDIRAFLRHPWMLGYHQQQNPYISSASTGPLSSAKSATLVPSTYNISTANDMSVVSAPADTAILTTLPISDITVSTQGMTNTVALTRPRDTTVSMSGLSNLLNIPKQQYHPECEVGRTEPEILGGQSSTITPWNPQAVDRVHDTFLPIENSSAVSSASCHHLQRPFAVAPLHESQPSSCVAPLPSPLPMPVPYTIPICEQSESLAESNGYWPDLDGQILSTPIVASPAFTFANLTSVPSAYATQYAESKEALSSTPVVPTLPPLHLPLDLLQAAADALATEVHLQTKSTSSHACTCTAASDVQQHCIHHTYNHASNLYENGYFCTRQLGTLKDHASECASPTHVLVDSLHQCSIDMPLATPLTPAAPNNTPASSIHGFPLEIANSILQKQHQNTSTEPSYYSSTILSAAAAILSLAGSRPSGILSLRPTSSASTTGSCSAMDTAQDTSTLAPCESASTTTASIISSSAEISTPPPVLTRQAANAPMKMYQEMFEMDDVQYAHQHHDSLDAHSANPILQPLSSPCVPGILAELKSPALSCPPISPYMNLYSPGSYRDPAVSISPSVKQSGVVSSIYDTRLSAAVSSKLSGTKRQPEFGLRHNHANGSLSGSCSPGSNNIGLGTRLPRISRRQGGNLLSPVSGMSGHHNGQYHYYLQPQQNSVVNLGFNLDMSESSLLLRRRRKKSESGIRVNDNLNTTPASSTRMQLVSPKPAAQAASHQEILDSELDGTGKVACASTVKETISNHSYSR
ncbi:Protein kinase, variant 2 [Batrachochytrium dendrobatidis]|nr:Protein kinase, variant 2 [Batrachochytrium dendrobatidis]